MPTPGGLLKKGDRIRHVESGRTAIVLRRLGNDAGYGVCLRFDNDKAGYRIMTNAGYWIEHGWELVK